MPTRRPAPPPLLRPPRRPLRPILIGLVLSLVGMFGGIVVGLRLRPPGMPVTAGAGPSVPQPAAMSAQPAAPTTSASDSAALGAQLGALRRTLEQEQARLEALTRARATAEAEHQARLDSLARARATAEAQLAVLQRELAAAQREASAQRDTAMAPRRDAAAAAVPPAPRPPRAEGSGGQPRVLVHHRAGSPAAAEAAAALMGSLREGGFETAELRASPAVPAQRVVRYFHADDAAAAARLAGRLGRGWAIQDFRGYEPSPGPGTLEVWVPDR